MGEVVIPAVRFAPCRDEGRPTRSATWGSPRPAPPTPRTPPGRSSDPAGAQGEQREGAGGGDHVSDRHVLLRAVCQVPGRPARSAASGTPAAAYCRRSLPAAIARSWASPPPAPATASRTAGSSGWPGGQLAAGERAAGPHDPHRMRGQPRVSGAEVGQPSSNAARAVGHRLADTDAVAAFGDEPVRHRARPVPGPHRPIDSPYGNGLPPNGGRRPAAARPRTRAARRGPARTPRSR